MTQQPDGAADVTSTPPVVYFLLLTLAVFGLQQLWVISALLVLRDSGFYDWYYSPAFVAVANGAKSDLQRVAVTRLHLWAIALAFPFWIASVALLVWRLPASCCRDVMVSWGRFPRRDENAVVNWLAVAPSAVGMNVLLGVAVWLALAPAVLIVNLLMGWLHLSLFNIAPEEHPLTVAATTGQLQPAEWWLIACSVMVSAPVWEELFFRGALSALCRSVRGGDHLAMLLAGVCALSMRRDQFAAANGLGAQMLAGLPALFVLAMTPLYLLVCYRSRTGEGPIVFATALLFAAVHSFAWPSPVALFLLGLGLGWLAVWTRSLIAPIVVHALFNAVSFALLLFG